MAFHNFCKAYRFKPFLRMSNEFVDQPRNSSRANAPSHVFRRIGRPRLQYRPWRPYIRFINGFRDFFLGDVILNTIDSIFGLLSFVYLFLTPPNICSCVSTYTSGQAVSVGRKPVPLYHPPVFTIIAAQPATLEQQQQLPLWSISEEALPVICAVRS
jgi:hypothetical protein